MSSEQIILSQYSDYLLCSDFYILLKSELTYLLIPFFQEAMCKTSSFAAFCLYPILHSAQVLLGQTGSRPLSKLSLVPSGY